MSGVYKSILQGKTQGYYMDLLVNMYNCVKDEQFEWKKLTDNCKDLNRSNLTRLKCSGFLLKIKDSKRKTQLWKLHPEVKSILREKKLI